MLGRIQTFKWESKSDLERLHGGELPSGILLTILKDALRAQWSTSRLIVTLWATYGHTMVVERINSCVWDAVRGVPECGHEQSATFFTSILLLRVKSTSRRFIIKYRRRRHFLTSKTSLLLSLTEVRLTYWTKRWNSIPRELPDCTLRTPSWTLPPTFAAPPYAPTSRYEHRSVELLGVQSSSASHYSTVWC